MDETAPLAYTPPLDWGALCAFVGARGALGVERAADGRYERTLRVGDDVGWLAVEPHASGDALSLELSPSLESARAQLEEVARRAFDLDADPERILARLGELAAPRPGLRIPGAFDAFELVVRAVLGQQISVRAASTLASRLGAAYGERLDTPLPGVDRLTPTAAALAAARADDLVGLGITRARAATIVGLARAVVEGRVVLAPEGAAQTAVAALLELPGIGDWTAQYVAMRALGDADAFPAGDLALRRALGVTSAAEAERRAEAWRPLRAYAAMHLWRRVAAAA